jgi:hypothetical protein
VIGWFLGGQKSTRAGQFSPDFLGRCFELPFPSKEQTPKNVIKIKKIEKIGFGSG